MRIREDSLSPTRKSSNSRISDLNRTPPPMSLTDEEFRKRFLPDTPEKCDISLDEDLGG